MNKKVGTIVMIFYNIITMKNNFVYALIMCLVFAGCSKSNKVEYKEAAGYFVRNDVAGGTIVEKITSQEQFDKYFGMATTMSQQPTAIDFSKEFVAAIILPQSNQANEIKIDSLVHNGSKLNLYYSVSGGNNQNYEPRPLSILIIDRKHEGDLGIMANGTKNDTPVAEMHNARNSLDFTGSYEGTIPCGDCSGIEVVVTINGDGTYTNKMTYIGKEPDNVFTTQGKYQWDNSGSKITLIDESGSDNDMYKVEENRLIMLDEQGEVITGDLSDMYILRKQ